MKVKVTVDYTNGCYNVTGFHEKEGKNHSLYKDITSYSYYSGIVYEKNYNKIAIEERKRKIRREINKIKNQDPSFKFSKNALSEVDTLLYEALKDWDNLLGNHTNYATDFLKIIMKDYTPTERESHAKILSRKSRKQCMIERADALKKAGIDITYNVGIFNTSKKLSLSDKIKGIMLAKKQKRFIGAKVINNIIVKESIFNYDRFFKFENEANQKNEADIENSEENSKSKKASKTKINLPKKLYRKISDIKDSIKNKKFISKNFKKIVIRGIATTLAIGGITTAAKIGGTLFRNSNNDNKTAKYQTEFNTNNIIKPESEIVSESETQSETETITESETQSETETVTETETQSESETITEPETQSETETITETETQSESETITEPETQSESETITESETENYETAEKTTKKKIKKFKKYAIRKYKDSFVIGEKPNVGDLLINEKYGENPDGSGNKGKFLTHPNYQVDHILIMTNDEWYTIRTEGKSLLQVLKEYPDRTGYSIHFSNSETNGGLGFITQAQLEELIEKQVNDMIENKKAENSKQIDSNDVIR